MAVYNVTFGFRGMGVGWSETHSRSVGLENPIDLLPSAINIAQKRVTFLGREFEINVIRISSYSNADATQRVKGVFPHKQIFKNPDQTKTMAAEPSNVAVAGIGYSNAQIGGEFSKHTNRTYCGAPPDDSVTNGGVVLPEKSGLGTNFNMWAAALAADGYGWLVSKELKDLEISTIDQRPDGRVEFTTIGDLPVGSLNKVYPMRIRAVNNGTSPLNGAIIGRVTAANKFISTEVIGLALAQTGGAVRVYQRIYPFVPFAGLTLDLESVKHKRGRPFGSEPGRQRKRIRG